MKQEVIQDFLNLPGILEFALMDGRSRPYFDGVDRTLNQVQLENGHFPIRETTVLDLDKV